MNTETKKSSKILAIQIQQFIKNMIRHVEVGFTSVIQGWFNICQSVNIIYHISKMKDTNQMIISIQVEKAFGKIEHPFMIKSFNKVGTEEMYFDIIKATYDKPTANIISNSGKLKALPPG